MSKDYGKLALQLHKKYQGKLEVRSKVDLLSEEDLSTAYTPGVATPCLEIEKHPDHVYTYTNKGNTIAVVTDGTAVLGLGNIGPKASLPVMEGKAILFKKFAGVDAFPICLDTTDKEEIVSIVKNISPGFGGINLEDISAPNCFYIEEALKKISDIPIFHDDQHGTAIVTLAALINSLKVVGKEMKDIRIAVNGAGAAGVAITKLLVDMGIGDVFLCDRTGIIYEGRQEGMNPYKEAISKVTNREGRQGSLAEALKGADVFIGVSAAGAVTESMVESMAADSIIMAMANPVPEIMPDLALSHGARVVCTGRSDFPNQVNNVLAFPGVLRGALDVRARDINEEMKIAAAYAIAELVDQEALSEIHVIPSALDERVVDAVAQRVKDAARKSGVARI